MGYMTLLASCFVCKRRFWSNPHKVPSYQGEPICLTCITVVNEARAEMGLELWPVSADAYQSVEVDG